MSGGNKFSKIIADRTSAPPPPVTGTADSDVMKTTVYLSRYTRAQLTRVFTDLGLEHKRNVKVGQVGAALFEIFIDDPQVQEEVLKRLT